MRRRRAIALASLGLLAAGGLLPPFAGALELQYGADGRGASVSGCTGVPNSNLQCNPVFLDGGHGVVLDTPDLHGGTAIGYEAWLSSTLTSTSMQALAETTGSGLAGFQQVDALAYFVIDFSVDEPAAFRLTGELGPYLPGGGAQVALLREEPWPQSWTPLVTVSPGSFDESGVLQPGVAYQIRLQARTWSNPGPLSPTFSLQFAIQPIPEPASGLLLGAGLAWLGVRSRQRRTRHAFVSTPESRAT